MGRIPGVELWQVRIANPENRLERLDRAKATLEASGAFEVVTRNLLSQEESVGRPASDLAKDVRRPAIPRQESAHRGRRGELGPGRQGGGCPLEVGSHDRACSFAALRAILDLDGTPRHTAVAYLTDREEIGSTGTSGARSRYFQLAVAALLSGQGEAYTTQLLRRTLARSRAISGDVTAGLNPLFPHVHVPRTAARMGGGPAILKHTGHGGKQGASDAHAEYLAYVRRIFDEAGIPWQVSTLGRVDEGGGGTIAWILAETGMQVLDVGVPLLSMHAPLELSHKRDLYYLYRFYGAFFRAAE